MEHKKLILLALLTLFPALAYCQNKKEMKFSVKVIDDVGSPISNCEVGAIISVKTMGKSAYKRTTSNTDKTGIAYFDLKSSHSRVSYGATAPDGYYRSFGGEFFFKSAQLGTWQPENKKFQVVLNRKVNPIAMYAKKGPKKPPVLGKNIGYDLQLGDWVSPYGKGKISDVVFNMNYNSIAPNEFTSILTVDFPNESDGMIAFEAPIEKEQKSQLRSGYQAPEKGYLKSLTHNWVRTHGKPDVNTRKRTRNYYIRVRTKLDKDGNVTSAQYGKIYGDFMNFIHYLNPTVNDRNVEFDPKKNLIDTGFRGHEVQSP